MTSIHHTAFFGDAEHQFCLNDAMIAELETITGSGIGTLFLRLVASQFHMGDLTAIIRLGLIGAGMNPEKALRLVQTYAVDRPLDEVFPLALDIVTARWSGKPDQEAAA